MRNRRIICYAFADFVAISNRHEHVCKHQVRLQIRNLADRGFAIAHRNDFDALILQGQPYHLLDVAIVVRNQDLGHRLSSAAHTRPKSRRKGCGSLQEYWSIEGGTRQRKPPLGVSEGTCRRYRHCSAATVYLAGQSTTRE